MLVICEGSKICGRKDCYHRRIHEYQEYDGDSYTNSCSDNCCTKFPYHCTHESYILYIRKDKLNKLEDVSNL